MIILYYLLVFLTKIVEQVKPIKVYNNFKNDRMHLLKERPKK